MSSGWLNLASLGLTSYQKDLPKQAVLAGYEQRFHSPMWNEAECSDCCELSSPNEHEQCCSCRASNIVNPEEKAVQMMCNSLFIIRLYEIPGCTRRSGMDVKPPTLSRVEWILCDLNPSFMLHWKLLLKCLGPTTVTKVMTPAHRGTRDDMVWTCWRLFSHEVMEGRAFALSWQLGSYAAAFPEEVALI